MCGDSTHTSGMISAGSLSIVYYNYQIHPSTMNIPKNYFDIQITQVNLTLDEATVET